MNYRPPIGNFLTRRPPADCLGKEISKTPFRNFAFALSTST
jgi:hypothetical protein